METPEKVHAHLPAERNHKMLLQDHMQSWIDAGFHYQNSSPPRGCRFNCDHGDCDCVIAHPYNRLTCKIGDKTFDVCLECAKGRPFSFHAFGYKGNPCGEKMLASHGDGDASSELDTKKSVYPQLTCGHELTEGRSCMYVCVCDRPYMMWSRF